MSAQASENLFPEVGDLVVATVNKVEDYGAYVKLDEFAGIEGLVHISEISTTWVRNIRDHAREGQKLVLKVLRVNPQRNQIDLSLRRVTGREKSEKMLEWKKERKAEAILKSAAEKLKKPEDDAESIKETILEKFGGLYDPLEEAIDEGSEALVKAGLSEEWAQAIVEVSKSKIKLERSKVRGTIAVTCHKPGGLEIIRQTLLGAKKVRRPRGSEIKIYTVGSPKYRVEIEAGSFESAEKALNSVMDDILESIKKAGGEGRKIG
ncbi:MAG TPA: translation initiation factor IF-2 subunit alpha [Candidatus Bathyarchaeia archaeon]|nr:translation initiation factor IF-2 subunit alpha [Candidatus Bathyarchaeia archaeon]